MRAFLVKNWFFIGIVLMVLIAFSFPPAGIFVRKYSILKVGIFLAFFTTGLTLETSSIFKQLKNVKVLVSALVSSLFLFPGMAYFLANMTFSSQDFVVGALIIGVAPVTIAAGTVMTSMAKGNVPLSLFICVLCNFVSILTIPFLLSLFLSFGEKIDLPVLRMLGSLTITVLVPTVIGQLLRPRLKERIKPYQRSFSIFAQCIVLLIIFNAVSSSATKILQVGFDVVFAFVFMIGLHLIVLTVNYGIAKGIRLDRPSTAAFTIHTSQKTLTVSYLVWAGYFAQTYPMALITPIAYHMTQIIMDTFVAQRFRNNMVRAQGELEHA